MLFNGLPEMNVENVTVTNSTVEAEVGAEINESTNVTFRNVRIVPRKGAALKINNSKSVTIEDFICPEGGAGLEVTGSRNKDITISSEFITAERAKITAKAEGEVTIL
jgi:regulator of protease activity HflC (stomatin/prohibitin superfamily)